jgi:membrane protein implicated in regulation of membrane protease activity
MEQNLIWIWAGLAVLFFIAELFTAGFFLVCFGVGAVASAVAAGLGVPPIWQLAIFVTTSALALLLLRPFAQRINRTTPNQVGGDRAIGREAVVTEAIDPATGRGMVRVERESWRAELDDHTPAAEGERVRVIRVEGTRLIVRRPAA